MTSCVPIDRLIQTATVECAGVTEAMIKLQVFNVMDEFFRRTNAWHYKQDIDLEQGEYRYDVPVPSGTVIIRWLGVSHKDTPLVPLAAQAGATMSSLGTLLPEQTFPDGDAAFLPAASDVAPGTGVFSYAIYRPNYISITSTPSPEDVKYPLTVELSLTLDKGCLEEECGDWNLEEWMYDMYFQDWLDGVLGRLQGMVNKPWSNATMAAYHGKRFRNAMAFRTQEARRGFIYGVPAWRFPRGW